MECIGDSLDFGVNFWTPVWTFFRMLELGQTIDGIYGGLARFWGQFSDPRSRSIANERKIAPKVGGFSWGLASLA